MVERLVKRRSAEANDTLVRSKRKSKAKETRRDERPQKQLPDRAQKGDETKDKHRKTPELLLSGRGKTKRPKQSQRLRYLTLPENKHKRKRKDLPPVEKGRLKNP